MRTARSPALLLVALLAVAGCNGSEEAQPEPTASPAAAPAASSTSTAPARDCRPPDPPASETDGSTLSVYFFCPLGPDARVVPAPRRVPAADATVRTALELLIKGPTPEERQAGLWSALDRYEDGRLLAGVDVTDGHAVIDVTGQLAEQYTTGDTTFAEQLFTALDSTVFQFPSVTRVTYRMDGDAGAVCRHFPRPCEPLMRGQWEQGQAGAALPG